MKKNIIVNIGGNICALPYFRLEMNGSSIRIFLVDDTTLSAVEVNGTIVVYSYDEDSVIMRDVIQRLTHLTVSNDIEKENDSFLGRILKLN